MVYMVSTLIMATTQSKYGTFSSDLVMVPPMENVWEMHTAIQLIEYVPLMASCSYSGLQD